MMGVDISTVLLPCPHHRIYFWINYLGNMYDWWVDLDYGELHLVPQCEARADRAFQRLKERLKP